MTPMTYAEALNDALRHEMRRDDRVIVLGEDVAVYGGIFGVTKGFLDEFGPGRVVDTPISEKGIVGWQSAWPCPVYDRWWRSCTAISCVWLSTLANAASVYPFVSQGKVNIPLASIFRAA